MLGFQASLVYKMKQDIQIYAAYSRPNGWTEWAEFLCAHSWVAEGCCRLKKLKFFVTTTENKCSAYVTNTENKCTAYVTTKENKCTAYVTNVRHELQCLKMNVRHALQFVGKCKYNIL